MRGRPSLSSKAQKQNRFKWSKRDQLSFMRRRLHVNHYLWQCGLRLYIRELGEVCGVEVQPLHQALHQVRALVSGEGAGGETHRQPGVTFRRPYPYEIHVATQPLKCYSFFSFFFFFLGRYCHNSYSQMGHCTQAKATVVWMDVLRTCTRTHHRQTHKARTNTNKHTKSRAKGKGISCLFRLGKSPAFFQQWDKQ